MMEWGAAQLVAASDQSAAQATADANDIARENLQTESRVTGTYALWQLLKKVATGMYRGIKYTKAAWSTFAKTGLGKVVVGGLTVAKKVFQVIIFIVGWLIRAPLATKCILLMVHQFISNMCYGFQGALGRVQTVSVPPLQYGLEKTTEIITYITKNFEGQIYEYVMNMALGLSVKFVVNCTGAAIAVFTRIFPTRLLTGAASSFGWAFSKVGGAVSTGITFISWFVKGISKAFFTALQQAAKESIEQQVYAKDLETGAMVLYDIIFEIMINCWQAKTVKVIDWSNITGMPDYLKQRTPEVDTEAAPEVDTEAAFEKYTEGLYGPLPYYETRAKHFEDMVKLAEVETAFDKAAVEEADAAEAAEAAKRAKRSSAVGKEIVRKLDIMKAAREIKQEKEKEEELKRKQQQTQAADDSHNLKILKAMHQHADSLSERIEKETDPAIKEILQKQSNEAERRIIDVQTKAYPPKEPSFMDKMLDKMREMR